MPNGFSVHSAEYRALQERAAHNRELLMRDANGSGDPREAARLRVAERALSQLMKDAKAAATDGHVAVRFSRAKNVGITVVMVKMFAEMLKLYERVVELEKKPTLEYCGGWGPDNLYTRGNVVTHQGSCWHCNYEETSDEPGKGEAFTLMVKRGKDARWEVSRKRCNCVCAISPCTVASLVGRLISASPAGPRCCTGTPTCR